MKNKDIPTICARVFSDVFCPLLVPTYGIGFALMATVLSFLVSDVKWSVMGIVFLTTGVIPALAIVALWRMKYISEPGLNNRSERTVPYLITGLSYALCAIWLWQAHAPMWLWGFPAGGAIAVVIGVLINLKWKISAHMAAMGGLVAMNAQIAMEGVATTSAMACWFSLAVVLSGLVGASRIWLGRHTLWQVIAGFFLGLVCVLVF